MVVTNSALYRIGSRRRRCAGRIVGRVYAVGVQAQVIVQGLAVGGEGDIQALGLAVAAGKSKSDVRPALPFLQHSRMQRFFIRRLLRFAKHGGDVGDRLGDCPRI